MRRRIGVATALLMVVATTACESEADKEAEKQLSSTSTTDLSVCTSEASAAPTPYPQGFPAAWPFPPGTIVVNAEDRGASGIVVSAVSSTSFPEVLKFLNGPVQDQGYKVSEGETEDHDAEANWSGNGFHGRWAIKDSATCPGETTIQVLSTSGD